MRANLTDGRVSAGEIFDRLGEILRENAVPAVGCVLLLTAVNVALDALFGDSTGATAPAAIASLIAQYHVTEAALDRRGLREPGGRRRYGSFLLLNLMSGIAILLGYLFLILPGLYLGARWTIASAIMLSGERKAGDALNESWSLTKSAVWGIIGTLLVIFVPACVVAIGLLVTLEESFPVLSSSVAYLLLFGAFVTSWLAGVAIYSLLRPDQDDLAEVFA